MIVTNFIFDTKNLSPPTIFEVEIPYFAQKDLGKNAGFQHNVFLNKSFVSWFFQKNLKKTWSS